MELSPGIITILMLGGLLVGVMTGFPLGLVIGAVGLIFGLLLWGGVVGELVYTRVFSIFTNYVLLAVPLFIFMGLMLGHSGIAETMYDALYLWLGGLRGGLSVVTVMIGTILAACMGTIAAEITILAYVALPSMLKRGYKKSFACGCICAGGCLGVLIPPSVMLVIYGPMAEISVGKLFMGAIGPGLLLSSLYISYILLFSAFQPTVAPAVPPEERSVPFIKKMTTLMTSLVPPVFLVLAVLGSIFFGIAPPTEAASVGAFAATLLTVAYRKFSWRILKEATLETVRVCGFIFLIASLAVFFTGVFLGAGCGAVVQDFILATGSRWGAFAIINFIIFILGMFMNWMGILFIMVPIMTPVITVMGFDPVWFAIMICINLQSAYMTPPYASAIFILKGSADPELGVTLVDIIRGVMPYIAIVLVGLILCIFFPEIITWLPGKMIK